MSLNTKDRPVIERMLKYCDDISRLMEIYGGDFDRIQVRYII